ncbi:hypothetical protein TNCV_1371581 [Trichonephila clavipes]|nr:hypothetical protein TNCV_1371581 [Trichonephila clavipes]
MVAERQVALYTITKIDKLRHLVEATWAPVPLHAIQSLFDSMPMRISAVITLNDGASRTVSKWTGQHSLHRMGFGSHRPAGVPVLNARHRDVRLAWTREHRNWRLEDWK